MTTSTLPEMPARRPQLPRRRAGSEAHPVADIFPMMSDAELLDLVEDVRSHGLREPIWLHRDGRIIDGRNRAIACQQLGIEPETRVFEGDDSELVAFVVSLNLHRRHLTESQRAMVAARIANLKPGRPDNSVNSQGLKLPSAIAVRKGDGIYYVRADLATWDELMAGLNEREQNIVRAVVKRDQYQEAVDRLRAYMENDPTCTVADALRREKSGN